MGLSPHIYKGTSSGQFLIQGEEALISVFMRNPLVMCRFGKIQMGQFYRFECRRRLAFCLKNDMGDLGTMKRYVELGRTFDFHLKLLDHRPQDLSGGQKQRVS